MKYPNNQYSQAAYEAKHALAKELNSLDTGYKFAVKEDPTNDSRESVELRGLIPIVALPKDSYRKKYGFFLIYTHLPYIDYNAYEIVAKNYTKPNEIGVLTANKVTAWIEYLIKIYEELVQMSTDKQAKIESFLAECTAAGGTVRRKVYEYNSNVAISGSIIKNGLNFSFTVDTQNGYIAKKLALDYHVPNDITAFLQLADNKYTEKEI